MANYPAGTLLVVIRSRAADYLALPKVREALECTPLDLSQEQWRGLVAAYIRKRHSFVAISRYGTSDKMMGIVDGHRVTLPVVPRFVRKAKPGHDKCHMSRQGLLAALKRRTAAGGEAMTSRYLARGLASGTIETRKARFKAVLAAKDLDNTFSVCDVSCCAHVGGFNMYRVAALASTQRCVEPTFRNYCEEHFLAASLHVVSCYHCGQRFDARETEVDIVHAPCANVEISGRVALLDAQQRQARAPFILFRQSPSPSTVQPCTAGLCAACINARADDDSLPATLYRLSDGTFSTVPPPPPADAELRAYSTNVLNVCAAPGGKLLYVELGADGAMVTGSLADTGLTLFGVELEVETNLTASAMVAAMPRVGGRPVAIVKRDGSLDRNRGREVVTLPMTMSAQRAWWREFLEHPAVAKRLSSYRGTGGRCGCHIHVGRAALTSAQSACIAYLVAHAGEANARLTDYIARRRYSNYARRAALAKGVLAHQLEQAMSAYRHYGAVSYSRHGTLEIRIYKGTSLFEGLEIYLDHAESLVNYAQARIDPSMGGLPADTQVGEPADYLSWLAGQAGYERLKRHLARYSDEFQPPWRRSSSAVGATLEELADATDEVDVTDEV